MKSIYISSLGHDEKLIQTLMATLKKYGLEIQGHFWIDDLKHMNWLAPLEPIVLGENALWIIVGSVRDLTETVRYGLSLLALSVQSVRGIAFPIIFLKTEGEISVDDLPTALKGVEIYSVNEPTLGAKMVARANTPIKPIEVDYRLNVHGHPSIGLWFEIGPAGDRVWHGCLFGTSSGEIDAHGTGPAGKLPERAVLEYPVQGLKLKLGQTDFTAWAVQNKFGAADSYFVRVREVAGSIIFGPYSADDDCEVHTLRLV